MVNIDGMNVIGVGIFGILKKKKMPGTCGKQKCRSPYWNKKSVGNLVQELKNQNLKNSAKNK